MEALNLEYKVSLIKVSIESSLQPLIQLHVILARLLEKSIIDGNANINWAQTMEAFVRKDLLTIFNISQAFNPQVNMLIVRLTLSKDSYRDGRNTPH
jgi:hypothetical protein